MKWCYGNKWGADAVVVQGRQAGGHQGGWLYDEAERITTFELLTQALKLSCVPLIASGGIADAKAVRDALMMGADMVAVGTAFLTTTESVIDELWKAKLLSACAKDTHLTRLFSGKLARGLVNDYLREFADIDGVIKHAQIPPYPELNAMTKELRATAKHLKDPNLMSLWAGTSVDKCRDESISELIDRLLN
ncbi:nitronate monooxygenase [Moraxella nasovis]|uniref:NAD(P)H-dependent flavin oxidoreductase n=1 Tax=Moraxella nasovis TaxID=2904121 RepID=UPI001F601BAF|nr:nitronate monooxygenase [Moraxella nasovis]UNU73723.1 nitronate monooxygenase [Moraxella nasovis]